MSGIGTTAPASRSACHAPCEQESAGATIVAEEVAAFRSVDVDLKG